jgi:hypothetical protein
MDGRCATCRHWDQYMGDWDVDSNYGWCEKINPSLHDETGKAPVSASESCAFATRNDFGCVLYERKE